MCADEYPGVVTLTQQQIEQKYHVSEVDLANSTRIILSYGGFDPTTGFAPSPFPHRPITDRNASRFLLVSDMAHREDLFAPDPTDRPAVIEVRRLLLSVSRAEC